MNVSKQNHAETMAMYAAQVKAMRETEVPKPERIAAAPTQSGQDMIAAGYEQQLKNMRRSGITSTQLAA